MAVDRVENQFPDQEFTHRLLQWFQENARKLPWRETADPYAVWLSEIMLQQTRVVAVLEYYRRFLEELPTIAHLAECPEDKLMKLWQGLGYYNRARNLQKAAIQMMEQYNGRFPETYEEIHGLSGIGDYTAGAIASTVFGLPYPAVDGNVLRVVARYTENYGDITTSAMKKEVTVWVVDHMPRNVVRDYNQGLMELGATVCLPNGTPRCEACPVQEGCACGNNEKWKELPVKASKKPRRIEYRQVYLVKKQGKFALCQRPEKGLLANLWEFPQGLKEENPWALWKMGEDVDKPKLLITGIHIFSHIEWRMEGFTVDLPENAQTPEHWVFVTLEELRDIYSVPSAFAFLNPVVNDY